MDHGQQAKIESILNKVSSGDYPVQPYGNRSAKSEEHRVCLRHSMLNYGQLHDILVTVRNLGRDSPVVEVVVGNTRQEIIDEFRQEGVLRFIPKYRFVEAEDADAIYAAAKFVREDHTKFQKGFYGAVHLYDGVHALARANQKASAKADTRIETCADVGKLCGCNEKFVRLARRMVKLDSWFYTYVYEDRNSMPVSDGKDLLAMPDPNKQGDIIAKMKELYEEDRAKASKYSLKTARENGTTPNEAEGDDIALPDEDADIIYGDFGKEYKSLYKRAKAKVEYIEPEHQKKTDEAKLTRAFGGYLPSEEDIDREMARQAEKGAGEEVVYVDRYGDGDKLVTVSFDLTDSLAEAISEVCRAHGMSVTIIVDRSSRSAA